MTCLCIYRGEGEVVTCEGCRTREHLGDVLEREQALHVELAAALARVAVLEAELSAAVSSFSRALAVSNGRPPWLRIRPTRAGDSRAGTARRIPRRSTERADR